VWSPRPPFGWAHGGHQETGKDILKERAHKENTHKLLGFTVTPDDLKLVADATENRILDQLIAIQPVSGRADAFIGESFDYGPLRVYGGHFVGQALAAAFATVPAPRLCNSLHAYFLRVGDPRAPFHFTVDRLRDGGSYVNRYVRVEQNGHAVFALMASFKDLEPASEHQPLMPAVPGADEVMAKRQARGAERFPFPYTVGTSVEVEVLDGWNPRESTPSEHPIQLWLRGTIAAHDDARIQQCALAYLSDSTLLFNGMRRHGSVMTGYRITSLDHALWFHRVPDCSQWMFYDQQGPVAADGRTMNHGRIWSAGGDLLATAAQEGMLRKV
jgi:acyl-CoA thioesterase-2